MIKTNGTMNPANFHSWLRGPQQLRSFPFGREDPFKEALHRPNSTMHPFSVVPPAAAAAPAVAAEPLDLSVKPAKPSDSSVPLDLSVAKTASCAPCAESTQESHTRGSSIRTGLVLPHPQQYQCNVNTSPGFMQCGFDVLPHSSDRKLHCSYCGYQCEVHLKAIFEQHVFEHKSQPCCIHCSRLFSDPVALQEHLPLHDLLYIHICTICGLAFKLKLSHTAHMAERHPRLATSNTNGKRSPQSVPDSMLLKIGSSPSSSSDRRRSASMSSSSDHLSSPTSFVSTGYSTASPLSQKTFGQSLAKECEKMAGGKTLNLAEMLFMKSEDEHGSAECAPKLNLRSLLERVVEESIRAGPNGAVKKPDLKFMVTFSDDEDEEEEKKDGNSTPAAAASRSDFNVAASSTFSREEVGESTNYCSSENQHGGSPYQSEISDMDQGESG